ncbi:MAG: HAD-IIIA family hydrolase [Opitutaceae bacterium]|nr:HAD-IIIA family hydrolase [Cephaloticoccus sp.]MCP5531059.1 HAD-IIIA family hydrolase [Opitutaceae bacterium]
MGVGSPSSVKPGLPAVFLDRDGTLNVPLMRDGLPFAPATADEFELYPDAVAGCNALHAAGYILIVATNQPELGRGTLDPAALAAMHAKLNTWVPVISRIEVCPAPGRGVAHPENRRRKPEPGMILDAATALRLDLERSWMVGDRWRDVDCGRNAGVRTIFIDRGYRETLRQTPHFTVPDFASAVTTILAANLQ